MIYIFQYLTYCDVKLIFSERPDKTFWIGFLLPGLLNNFANE